MIQQMLAIWSLVPLPFLKPAWTSGSSQFAYCWSLGWRILSTYLLVWNECNCAVLWAFFGIPFLWDSLVAQRVKHLPAMRETQVRFLGWEDPLEKDMATSLQYSCLENPMDGGAWWAINIGHGVAESRTWLSDFTFTFYTHLRKDKYSLAL